MSGLFYIAHLLSVPEIRLLNQLFQYLRGNDNAMKSGKMKSGKLLKNLVRPAGIEPATTSLEGWCSIQLSYGRVRAMSFDGLCLGNLLTH